jgi:hypothetical protein
MEPIGCSFYKARKQFIKRATVLLSALQFGEGLRTCIGDKKKLIVPRLPRSFERFRDSQYFLMVRGDLGLLRNPETPPCGLTKLIAARHHTSSFTCMFNWRYPEIKTVFYAFVRIIDVINYDRGDGTRQRGRTKTFQYRLARVSCLLSACDSFHSKGGQKTVGSCLQTQTVLTVKRILATDISVFLPVIVLLSDWDCLSSMPKFHNQISLLVYSWVLC